MLWTFQLFKLTLQALLRSVLERRKWTSAVFFKQILFSSLSRYISTILSQQLRSTAIFHHCQCFAASVPRIWFGLAFANLDMLDVLAPYGRYSDVWAPKQVFWESQKASKRSNVWGIGAPSEGEVIAEHQEVISEKSISWIWVENNIQLCWPPVDVEEGFNVIVREKREVGISLEKNHYELQWFTTTIKIMITTTPTKWTQSPCDVVRQSCRSRALVWSDQRPQARWQAPAPPPDHQHECHHPWFFMIPE